MPFHRRIVEPASNLRNSSFLRTAAIALGFTVIYLYWIVKPIAEYPEADFYHWMGTANTLYTPFLLIIVFVWLLFTAILLFARKPGRLRTAIWALFLFCMICTFVKTHFFYHRFDSEPVAFSCAITLTLIVTLLWRPSIADRFERALKPISTIMIFLGLLGAFIFSEISFYDIRGSLVDRHPPMHQRNAAETLQPHRIVWIIFDELSYQQTFEDRFPGLQLPSFDDLAATSTVFSRATPFHIRTEEVLPGLFTGKPFDKMRDSFSASASFRDASTGKWQTFNQHDTVFQDALNAGYSTAVAGWYNPYCRTIPAVLDSCYWEFLGPWNTLSPSGTLAFNTSDLIKQMIRGIASIGPQRLYDDILRRVGQPKGQLKLQRATQAQDYQLLQAHTDQLLRDPSYNFVFLHLPVPHPYGFYDRHTQQFTEGDASYIDNLALADACLSHIVQVLKQTDQWDATTVVLMGDHSWRTHQQWDHDFGWTKEDRLASHGQYDPRAAYLVKLPNQTTTARIDTPFHTVNTRKLFDALMTHQVNTPDDLAAWAQIHQ